MKHDLSSKSAQVVLPVARRGTLRFANTVVPVLLIAGFGAANLFYFHPSNSRDLIHVEGPPLKQSYHDFRLEAFDYHPAPVIVNTTPETLTIESFSSCGCIIMSGGPQQLPPFGKLELPFTIDPARGGTLADGMRRIEQEISLKAYTATRMQQLELPVSIQIFEPFVIRRDSRPVSFESFSGGKARMRLSSSLSTIVPLSVDAHETFVKPTLHWNDLNRDGEIALQFSEETPIGLSSVNIILTSKDSTSQKNFEIPISVSISCRLPVTGNIEAIVLDESIHESRIEFIAINPQVERFEILGSRSTLSGIDASIDQNKVTVVWNDSARSDQLRGQLIVHIRVHATERGLNQEFEHKVPIIVCKNFDTF